MVLKCQTNAQDVLYVFTYVSEGHNGRRKLGGIGQHPNADVVAPQLELTRGQGFLERL